MILVPNTTQYLAKTVTIIAMISKDVQSCKLTNVKYLDQHLVAEVISATTERRRRGWRDADSLNDDGWEVPTITIFLLCPLVVP